MDLIKFRIKNYKSIEDTGDCFFSDKITILAGKNESGKTSILEALEDFHEEKNIRAEAKPINHEGLPEISITFKVSQEQISSVFEQASIQQKIEDTTIDITLVKKFGSSKYYFDVNTRKQLGIRNQYLQTKNNISKLLQALSKELNFSQHGLKLPELHKQTLSDYKSEIVTTKTQTTGITSINDEEKKSLIECLNKIENEVDEFYKLEKQATDTVAEFVKQYLPCFIYFSSFDDEFPKQVELTELKTNPWALDLEEVSSFKIEKFLSTNDQERRNHQQQVNVDFSDKFEKYWTQDKIKLQVEKTDSKINFWIEENNVQYYPSQRSKGQQWFLSFYIKIVARINESKPNIILIDEPGLYLHAKAQKDLLKILNEYSANYPIIFSTHSPYLITTNNLEGIRLIEKHDNKTHIIGKIHSHHTADKETLTPILTAIGLGMNDSLTNINQLDNVVVEGPEDVFYLQAFKILNGTDIKTNFINGGGASNMGIVGSILEGWGAHVYYLYDNDQGKKDGEKCLKGKWKVLPESIKKVLNTDDRTIADILSNGDFKKFILDRPELTFATPNSVYIKKHKMDKVLLARLFLQKAKSQENVEVDDVTKNNIQILFNELSFDYEN
jgi:predicted ATP-dependent endonuclease of OLD family